MPPKRHRTLQYCTLISFLLILAPCTEIAAREPYIGYGYDAWDRSTRSPNGYLPDIALTGDDLGTGKLRAPQDLFVDGDGRIYITDSGNNRIIVLNDRFELERIIDSFRSGEDPVTMNDPHGAFVAPDGKTYVADTGNHRLLVIAADGKLLRVILKPESDIIPKAMEFNPTKVVVDSSGVIYVLAAGVFYGAIMYSQDGYFLGFFGANRVEQTLQVLADYFWKSIFSSEQRDKMMRYVPIEYSNFCIDPEDFIYTSTTVTRLSREEIKKLNPMGQNILRGRSTTQDYGDLERLIVGGQVIDSRFVAVAVDRNGFISALDQTRGRVFQYDQDSNLLFIFGNKGDQLGTFRSAVDVETLGDRLLVLDETKGSITVFSLTEYGEWVHKAIALYEDGRYAEAIEPWMEVLRRNSFYELAHIGLAKAALKTGDYSYSMDHYALAFHREGHSDAYQELRTEVLRRNFSLIVVLLVLSLTVLSLFARRRTRDSMAKLIVAANRRLRQRDR